MGLISTRELLDRYFESISETSTGKMQKLQIDKPELFEYEKKIGKELIDMDVDDLFGLIIELTSKRMGKEVKYFISHSSYYHITTLLRSIFNFYIENVQLIKNPLYDKRMKGNEALKRLSQGKTAFKWEDVEEIIRHLHRDYENDKADYIELILLLFYNGFSHSEEIISLKADMINHRNRTVKLPNKDVPIFLSERCYELLKKFNEIYYIQEWRTKYLLVSWRGSYFKFIVRPNKELEINERPLDTMCGIINRYISSYVNNKYDTKINYQTLYMLGFYEFIIGKHGKEKADKLITSYRNSDDSKELMSLAKEYGVNIENVSYLRRNLKPFVIADADK